MNAFIRLLMGIDMFAAIPLLLMTLITPLNSSGDGGRSQARNGNQGAFDGKELDVQQAGLGIHEIEIGSRSKQFKCVFEIEEGQAGKVTDEQQYAFGIVPDVKSFKFLWLKIYANGKILYLPRTAYNQLFQIKIAECKIINNGSLRVLIYGGDGADAYVCELGFDHEGLRRRVIYPLAADPKRTSEVTIYKYQFRDN